ncbi:uncharacterized protein LOC101210927 [Cucumis sativus]|uniref:Uncharacterized protein n=1 Tax=Cucumis sativus TaxID=3659 RepID=A0A0A0LR31_CUCSA|nr:uncharacterized protein LOC101210927 [Cucumis sativus]KGN62436.1 hypothetical protein Csa_018587 [Cucumis sativus]
MSNFTGSHCDNSGCESGWTMYFEESIETEERFRGSPVDYGGGEKEEEEERDLSMISDASSGPRNGYYEEKNCQSVSRSGGKLVAGKSKRQEEMGWRNQHSCLDDTASSPVFGLSKIRETNPYRNEGLADNVKEFSQTHSRKHGKKQTSFFQSSSVKKLAKNVSGDYQEQ